jgi:hypothetical protein
MRRKQVRRGDGLMRYTLLPEESPVSEWREVSVEEFVAELFADGKAVLASVDRCD